MSLRAPWHSAARFAAPPSSAASLRAHVINDQPSDLHSQTLIEALERAAAEDRLHLDLLDGRDQSHDLGYRDVLTGARRWAAWLANRGLKRGDKVIVLLPTGAEFVFAFYGVQMAGGVPVPCAPPYTFGGLEKYVANLGHVVRDCRATFFVTTARLKRAVGEVLGDRHSTVKHLVLDTDVTDEPLRTAGLPSLDGEDTAFLQYTSGTTGRPKGVVLTHRNLLANAWGIGLGLGMTPADVGMSWLPLFHDMGLIGVLLTSLYWRFPVHVMAPETFVLHPHRWLTNITRFRVTLSPAPNFAYHLCLRRVTEEQQAKLDLSSWRIALNGAEPVDHETVQAFGRRFGAVGFGGKTLLPVYGMAENSLAATFPDIENPYVVRRLDRAAIEQERRVVRANGSPVLPYHAVSVGYPLGGQEVAIVDEAGRVLDENQVGEIVVRGPSTTRGYFENPEESARVLRSGWLHTGDLGFLSERQLFVTGRTKDLIIVRGRNHYPYDIERVAEQVDGVRKGCLAAFAVANSETGTEDIVLVAETRETDKTARDRIVKEINAELLASLGVRADHVVLAPPKSIPKTSSGKVQRSAARQRYLDDRLTTSRVGDLLGAARSIVRSYVGHQLHRVRQRTEPTA